MALRPIATKFGRDDIINYGLNIALDQAAGIRDRAQLATQRRDNRVAFGQYNSQLKNVKDQKERDLIFQTMFSDPRLSVANREIVGRYLGAGRSGSKSSGGLGDVISSITGDGATTTGEVKTTNGADGSSSTTTKVVKPVIPPSNDLPLVNAVRDFDISATADSLEPGLAKAGLNILDAGTNLIQTLPGSRGARTIRDSVPGAIDATLSTLGPAAQSTNFTGNPNVGGTSTGAPLIPGADIPVPVAPVPVAPAPSIFTNAFDGTQTSQEDIDAINEAVRQRGANPAPAPAPVPVDPQASLGQRLLNTVIPTANADTVSATDPLPSNALDGVPLSTVPDLPDTPVGRTQAALNNYNGAITSLLPAEPAVTGVPLDVPTSPYPVDPTLTGTPLAPVGDVVTPIPPREAYLGSGQTSTAQVGIPTTRTPQQQEILERDFANPPSNRIAEFRQLNGLPPIAQEEGTRIDSFIQQLNADTQPIAPVGQPVTAAGGVTPTLPVSSIPDVPDAAAGAIPPVVQPPVVQPPVRDFVNGFTQTFQNDVLSGVGPNVTYRGLTPVIQQAWGADVDGHFGSNTANAGLASGLTYQQVNDMTESILRQQILASGRYQFEPVTLNELIVNYNNANPNDQIGSDTVFDEATQDKLVNYQLLNLPDSRAFRQGSTGNFINATPEARAQASNDLLYNMAGKWAGLPNPFDTDNGIGQTRLEPTANSAQMDVEEATGHIQNFFNTGDVRYLQNMIAEVETGTSEQSGYGVANTPGYFRLTDNEGNGQDESRLIFDGDVRQLTIQDIVDRSTQ